jgi:hypothetical protein
MLKQGMPEKNEEARFNPLPALTPESTRDLNVGCRSKRPKAPLV